MEDPLVRYYREHDDFLRYAAEDRARNRALSKLYAENRKYFGRRILDVACGGGVLAHVIEGQGREYVGIDKNPDMIKAAKAHPPKSKSRCSFVLGDAKSAEFEGVFDTVTLLGNALIHFSASELRETILNLEKHVSAKSHFMVEYRDVVSVLYDGKWSKEYVERRGRKFVTSLTRGIEAERGEIVIDSSRAGGRPLRFTHAIWSPFILESTMSGSSWTLVRRRTGQESYVWLDVYRRA